MTVLFSIVVTFPVSLSPFWRMISSADVPEWKTHNKANSTVIIIKFCLSVIVLVASSSQFPFMQKILPWNKAEEAKNVLQLIIRACHRSSKLA
jgi:hypothetical protein